MHLAKSGRLIVRLSTGGASVKSGELLIDSQGKRVGKVAELIGPVSAPYASVIPMTDRTAKLVGTKIFSGGFAVKKRDTRGRGQGKGFSRRPSRR